MALGYMQVQLSILKKQMFGQSSEKSKTDRPLNSKQENLLHNQSIVPEPIDEENIDLPEIQTIHDLMKVIKNVTLVTQQTSMK